MPPKCPNGGGFSGLDDKCIANPYPDDFGSGSGGGPNGSGGPNGQGDPKPCPDEGSPLKGKPVNIANGNVFISQPDFSLSGIMPINFTRYYNSKLAQSGLVRDFGNWGYNFDTRVISYYGISIYKVINSDGYIIYYNDTNGDRVYEADLPEGETSKLIKNSDNTFRREYKNGSKEEFNTLGYLTAVVDRNGNRITLTRNSYNKITTITDPSGREINLAYDTSMRITQITLPDGKIISYAYISNTYRLQKVTYPDGSYRTYEYSGYNLTGIKDENGHYIEKHTYNAQGKAITSSADGANEKLTIAYLSDTQSTVTDSLGRLTTYTIDKSGGRSHVTNISGPGCKECGQGNVSYTYDSNLRITSKTDGNGNVTTYTYDSNGNMLTRTEGYGTINQRTTTYTYDQFGQVLTITDPDGNITTNTYDEKGNLLSVRDSQNNITSYTYDSRGLKTSMTAPNGNTTIYTYDQYGNLSTITDPLGFATTNTRDIIGNALSLTDINNNITSYEYDLRYRLKKITAPDGGITNYEYDLAGNMTALTDPLGNRTVNTYDTINRLTKLTDPENNSIRGGRVCLDS